LLKNAQESGAAEGSGRGEGFERGELALLIEEELSPEGKKKQKEWRGGLRCGQRRFGREQDKKTGQESRETSGDTVKVNPRGRKLLEKKGRREGGKERKTDCL